MAVRANQDAVEHARRLIKGRQYQLHSDWSEAQPCTQQENEFIEQHGWEAFSEWHLAYDDKENEGTKKRYRFPFGDFERLHRSGLAAAEQRAGQQDYAEVESAARDLLDKMPNPG